MGLAADALVMTRTWPSPRSTMTGTTARRKWYGASMQPFTTVCRSSTDESRNRPTTIIPEKAVAESMRPKRSSPAATRRPAASGSLRSRAPSTTSTWVPAAVSSSTSSGFGSPSTRSWPRSAMSRDRAGPT